MAALVLAVGSAHDDIFGDVYLVGLPIWFVCWRFLAVVVSQFFLCLPLYPLLPYHHCPIFPTYLPPHLAYTFFIICYLDSHTVPHTMAFVALRTLPVRDGCFWHGLHLVPIGTYCLPTCYLY